MILTDGIEIFGEGPDKSAAITDAIANCQPQSRNADGWPLEPVTREWIDREMTVGRLWIDEATDAE